MPFGILVYIKPHLSNSKTANKGCSGSEKATEKFAYQDMTY
jgi:hypothetical protein